MKFINDAYAFRQVQSAIDALILHENHLPDQVFRNTLSHFLFISSDDIFYEKDFFSKLKSFVIDIGTNRIFLAVLDPDPEAYFFHHFGKYSVVEMSVHDTTSDYRAIIREDPGDSSADALESNLTVGVIYDDSAKWAIYFHRGYEFGIVAFADKEFRNLFASAYGRDLVLDVEEAIEKILKMVYQMRGGVPSNIRSQLIENYGSLSSARLNWDRERGGKKAW
jgi:hypothetical protein